MARKLTKKQRGFVKDIIRTGNGTESALNNYEIKSEDKKRVAASIASENLTKPDIQEALKPALERYQKELGKILDAMELKDKNSEQYRPLVDAADKMQKQRRIIEMPIKG